MKKKLNAIIALSAMAMAIGAAIGVNGYVKEEKKGEVVSAAATDTSFSWSSGEVLYINGQQSGGKSVYMDGVGTAVYFFDSSDDKNVNAWSEIVTHRVFTNSTDEYIPIIVPKFGGKSKTWDRLVVTRQKTTTGTPSFDNSWNQTENIEPSWVGAKNVIKLNNWSGGANGNMGWSPETYTHYGLKSGNHVYLDLSSYTDWTEDYAKFSVYFFNSDRFDGDAWASIYDGNHSNLSNSFVWKVEGKNDDYFYEGIVPQLNGIDVIWNGVIATRHNPSDTSPNFDWGQSNNFYFNSSNQNLNVLGVQGYNEDLDVTTSTTDNDRAIFYGTYFLSKTGEACVQNGSTNVATLNEKWTDCCNEYKMHCSDMVEWLIWNSTTGSTNDLTKAMERYDYINFKKSSYSLTKGDFVTRSTSGNSNKYGISRLVIPFMIENSSNQLITVIASTIVIALIVGGYFMLRKKRI